MFSKANPKSLDVWATFSSTWPLALTKTIGYKKKVWCTRFTLQSVRTAALSNVFTNNLIIVSTPHVSLCKKLNWWKSNLKIILITKFKFHICHSQVALSKMWSFKFGKMLCFFKKLNLECACPYYTQKQGLMPMCKSG